MRPKSSPWNRSYKEPSIDAKKRRVPTGQANDSKIKETEGSGESLDEGLEDQSPEGRRLQEELKEVWE